MQAGLAGDRAAFPSEIRFTKRGVGGAAGWGRPRAGAPGADDDTEPSGRR